MKGKETEELRWFLIKRFIIVLVLVGMSEYFINGLVDNVVFPVVHTQFFSNIDWEFSLSLLETIVILVIIFVELVLAVILSFAPGSSKGVVMWMMDGLERVGKRIVPDFNGSSSLLELSEFNAFLLFLVVIAVLVLIAIPYVIGAAYYATITTEEVRKIQEKREKTKREYDRKRNLMLSDIAHDLRTPITTISGYAKALSDGMVDDPKKKEEYLLAIQKKSERMNELINLLFEYVKLDSEGFVLDLQERDLAELVRANAALLYSDVEEKGMELVVDIPEEECMVFVDNIQLSRVITNLITNALRHNSPNTTIGIIMEKDDDDYRIAIADNGDPIPEEVADTLFEPFSVGDKSRNTKGGTGLGLSIAKKIVDMHGWELKLVNNYREYEKAFVIEIIN